MFVLIVVLLILLNGFFALSEIALVSSKKTKLVAAKQAGIKGATFALALLEDSEIFLSAIQIGITLVSFALGFFSGTYLADGIVPLIVWIGIPAHFSYHIATILVVMITTYVVSVIGELVPKSIALSQPEKIAIAVSPIIYYFSKTFYPFVRLLSISTHFLNNLFSIKKPSSSVTEEELRQMIKTASTEGVIEQEQNLIHEKVFYFSDKKAKHIMTHRTDIEWINLDAHSDVIEKEITAAKHGRILACHRSIEHIEGVLYLRKYLSAYLKNNAASILSYIFQPIVVPENTDAQNVLSLFKQKRIYFAIVVSEFGSIEGIITMHDIIENLVGSIPDTDEVYEPEVFVRDDKSVLVNGDAPIEILTNIIEGFTIDFEEIDYSTVAGFVLSYIDKMPAMGDKFIYGAYTIEIMDVDGNKIDKILITRN